MKLLIVSVMALIAFASANPIQVSDNNVGDIITVGVNAKLAIDNKINQNIVAVIIALLNQESTDVDINNPFGAPQIDLPKIDTSKISPELLTQIRNNLTPEMIAKAKSLMTPENLERISKVLKQ